MRISQKFTLALVLVVTGTVGVRAAVDTQRSVDHYRAEIRSAQRNLAEVLSVAVITVWQSQGWEAALELLRRVEREQGDTKIRWVWIQDQSREEYRPLEPLSRLEPLLHGAGSLELAPDAPDAPLISYHTVVLPDLPLGAVELAHSTEHEQAFVRRERWIQLGTGLLVVAVYAALAGILGWRLVSSPIQALVAHARRVAKGELDTPSAVAQRDEIGVLAQEMNRMSASLLEARERAARERAARMETHRQLTHADRLANVGRLAAVAAHAVGTPLQVISGRATMIANGEATGTEAKDGARRIVEQSERVAQSIRQLLVYARASDDEMELSAPLDLVHEVVGLLSPVAKGARVDIVVAEGGCRTKVRLSRAQIRQVILNLVSNAIQASEAGGRVEVAVREQVEADNGDSRHALAIEVADQGAGIASECIHRIFEPFFTTKEEGEGTGLGLSVCRAIVEQHGGHISVGSVLHEGTRFVVHLPIGGSHEG